MGRDKSLDRTGGMFGQLKPADEKVKKLEAMIKIDEVLKEEKSYHEFLLAVGALIFSLLSDEADF